jgi:hypothetical protein
MLPLSRVAAATSILALVAASGCSSSSSSASQKVNPQRDASEVDTGAADASADPVATFVVASTYATIIYEECMESGDASTDASPIDHYGDSDGGECRGEALDVVLTNNAKLTCDATASGANYLDVPGTVSMVLHFGTVTAPALKPGTYTLGSTVNAAILANVDFLSLDSTCTSYEPLVTGGSLTLTTITTTSATGSYDVKFKNGESLKGAFSASECATATPPEALGDGLDAGACASL